MVSQFFTYEFAASNYLSDLKSTDLIPFSSIKAEQIADNNRDGTTLLFKLSE